MREEDEKEARPAQEPEVGQEEWEARPHPNPLLRGEPRMHATRALMMEETFQYSVRGLPLACSRFGEL